MSAVSVLAFDYAELLPDQKGKLISLAGQIRKGRQHYIAAVFEVGEAIATAHSILSDHHKGTFAKWVEGECGIEERTAYNYMHAWQTFGAEGEKITIPATAMYLLSAPEAPEKAAKEAIKLADKGERITVARAKELLEKFRPTTPQKRGSPEIISELETVEAKEVATSELPAAKPGSNPAVCPEMYPEAYDADSGEDERTDSPKESAALEAEPVKELDFADRVKDVNGKIESFCRQLTKWFEENCPRVESVDHLGRYDSALSHVRAACRTMRTCKLEAEPCPKCKGEGCKTCEKESDFGAVSVLTFRQLAG